MKRREHGERGAKEWTARRNAPTRFLHLTGPTSASGTSCPISSHHQSNIPCKCMLTYSSLSFKIYCTFPKSGAPNIVRIDRLSRHSSPTPSEKAPSLALSYEVSSDEPEPPQARAWGRPKHHLDVDINRLEQLRLAGSSALTPRTGSISTLEAWE